MKSQSEPVEEICSGRLMARTLSFQLGKRSSILRRSTNTMKPGTIITGIVLAIFLYSFLILMPLLFI